MSIRSHNQFGAPGVSPWQVKNVFNLSMEDPQIIVCWCLLDVVVFQHHEALVLREVGNKEPWSLWERSWWDRKERPVSLQTLGQCSDPWPWGPEGCIVVCFWMEPAGVEYLARTPQNLSNTVWAYGVVVSKPRHLMAALQHHLTAASGFYVTRLGWWDVSSSLSSSIGSTWFNSEAACN